jgi:hypothetical protein
MMQGVRDEENRLIIGEMPQCSQPQPRAGNRHARRNRQCCSVESRKEGVAMRMQAVFCAIFKEQCVTRSYVKESIRLAVVDDAALTQPFLFTLDRVTSPLPLAHATPTHSSPHSPARLQLCMSTHFSDREDHLAVTARYL